MSRSHVPFQITAVALFSLLTVQAFAQTAPVSDRATLAGSDSLDLGTLGTPPEGISYSPVADIGISATSNGLLEMLVYEPNSTKATETMAVLSPETAEWPGTFPLVDGVAGPILSTNESFNVNIVPIEFSFLGEDGVCSFGLDIQPYFEAGFTAEIEGFDAAGVSLGEHTFVSTTDAKFVGMTSEQAMYSVQVRVTAQDVGFGTNVVAVNRPDFSLCETDPEPENIQVDIDIRPLTSYNLVNTCSKLEVPVAILSTEEYDVLDPATGIDYDTLMLEDAPVATIGWWRQYPLCGALDANGDGMRDLVCLFSQDDIDSLETTDTEASISALTWDEQVVEGADSVKVVHKCPSRWSWWH